MNTRDLLTQPVWDGNELGHAIPDSTHAVSVALPRWRDVVGYEEKDPEVIRRLTSGYPRFVIHPLVASLVETLDQSAANCLPFPSLRVAETCAAFVRRWAGASASVHAAPGFHAVITNAEGAATLKAFWQHTGLIVSSRQAQAILAGRPEVSDATAVRESLRQQLAGFYDCAPDDVFLTPTGMAAMFTALEALKARAPGLPTAQLGFPYVDTLKLQQKIGHGGVLLHHLDKVETELRELLRTQPLAGCFCELPGNPLLGSADVRQVTPILREQRVPLVVDDVVATPFNIDLSRHADLIATSLTKFIAGTGDVMGGALICNPHSPYHRELKSLVRRQHEELLWGGDAVVLEKQALDFPERMKRHNQNGLWLAEQLRAHPAVDKVWYPKWEFSEVYESVRRPAGGWGALVTFLPRQAETQSPKIFDALRICKGPSLGTVFTLACPFTLLAHYSELEWAESCGVSRHLIRVSAGLEDPAELWQRFEQALNAPTVAPATRR